MILDWTEGTFLGIAIVLRKTPATIPGKPYKDVFFWEYSEI